MKHAERNLAKRFDSPDRNARFTDLVYGYDGRAPEAVRREMRQSVEAFYPEANRYRLLFGDLHGHTSLSDGRVDVDTISAPCRIMIMAGWAGRPFGQSIRTPD